MAARNRRNTLVSKPSIRVKQQDYHDLIIPNNRQAAQLFTVIVALVCALLFLDGINGIQPMGVNSVAVQAVWSNFDLDFLFNALEIVWVGLGLIAFLYWGYCSILRKPELEFRIPVGLLFAILGITTFAYLLGWFMTGLHFSLPNGFGNIYLSSQPDVYDLLWATIGGACAGISAQLLSRKKGLVVPAAAIGLVLTILALVLNA